MGRDFKFRLKFVYPALWQQINDTDALFFSTGQFLLLGESPPHLLDQ